MSSRVALRRHLQPAPLHVPEAGDRGQLRRRSRRPRRVARRRSGRTPRRSTARASATRRATCSTAEGRRRRARQRHPARWSTTRSRRRTCCGRSSTAPTSSCTRRRSSSAATARRSAASSSTAASSTTGESGRFPGFTEPDPSYHGLCSTARGARPAAVHPQAAAAVPARHRPGDLAVQRVPVPPGARDAEAAHGAALGRTRWRSRSGSEGRDEVEWVNYPGLDVEPVARARSRSTCPRGRARSSRSSSRAGVEAGKRFVDALELHSHLANVGDVRSLAIHPASTTHSQLSRRGAVATGVTPGLVRLSVGIESIDDILADLEAGLPRRQGGVAVTPHRATALASRHRRVAGGRSARPPAVRTARASRCRWSPAASCRGVTVAYETWGTLAPDASNAVLVLHALTGDSHAAGPAGAGHGDAGWWDGASSGRGGRSTPTAGSSCAPTCSAAARARPGRRRHRAGRAPVRLALPARHDPRPGRASRPRSPTRSASSGGRASSAARWAGCGRSSGRSTEPDRVARLFLLAARRPATAEQIGLCACRWRDPRRPELARRRLLRRRARGGPHVGLGIARRIGAVSYRSEFELAQRFGRASQDGEDPCARRPLRGGVVPRLPRRQAGAPLRRGHLHAAVGGDEPPRRRPRPRRRARPASARVTARTLVAGMSSDRLYPLEQQQELAAGIPGAAELQVIDSPYGHDGFPHRGADRGAVARASCCAAG